MISSELPKAPPLPPWTPPKTNREWPLWTGVVLAMAVVPIGTVALFATTYGGHDRIDLIDSPEIVDALTVPCGRFEAASKRVPLDGSAKVRADALSRLAEVGAGLPAVIFSFPAKELEDDLPAAHWARDWEDILARINTYADDLSAGEDPTFEIPTTPDGFSIIGRMNFAVRTACEVPEAVVRLDPAPPPLPPGLPPDMYPGGISPSDASQKAIGLGFRASRELHMDAVRNEDFR